MAALLGILASLFHLGVGFFSQPIAKGLGGLLGLDLSFLPIPLRVGLGGPGVLQGLVGVLAVDEGYGQ